MFGALASSGSEDVNDTALEPSPVVIEIEDRIGVLPEVFTGALGDVKIGDKPTVPAYTKSEERAAESDRIYHWSTYDVLDDEWFPLLP